MKLPSEAEIRKQFGIAQKESFKVIQLAELPSPNEELKEGSKLEKRGYWNNFEVWLRTTIIGGIVLAVILIGDFINGVEKLYEVGYLIYTKHEVIADYTTNFAKYTKDKAIGFLVDRNKQPTEEDKKYPQYAMLTSGTSLYPVSGDWRPS